MRTTAYVILRLAQDDFFLGIHRFHCDKVVVLEQQARTVLDLVRDIRRRTLAKLDPEARSHPIPQNNLYEIANDLLPDHYDIDTPNDLTLQNAWIYVIIFPIVVFVVGAFYLRMREIK